MYKQQSQSFHNYEDTTMKMNTEIEHLNQRHIITQEKMISYDFYPHFHPYVVRLIRELLENSFSGLQEVDTKYVNTNGVLEILPNSTRVALSADINVTLAGQQMKIPAGTQFLLPDETEVTIQGEKAKLPGKMTVMQPKRIQVTVTSGTKTIEFGSQIKLVNNIIAELANINSILIPGGTELILISCKPKPEFYNKIFSKSNYDPSELVQQPHPVKDLDFMSTGAYSVYNWELFFHVPFTIAVNLSKNQRFQEAQQWFHYVFNPTDDSNGPTPERFWKVKPFQYTDVKKIEEILVNLSTGTDSDLKKETINSIGQWKDNPFRPHAVARYRQSSYMFKTVMAYIDNLVAWGDSLFRQDTGESINEATQLYVLAANILGPHPQVVPKKGSLRPQTYANIRADIENFGVVMSKLEPELCLDITPHPSNVSDHEGLKVIRSIGKTLYLCVPRNDKLINYWDTVADRLFKIRNSLNIQGIFRQLPLFEPPIDPALLARAAAAGLDVGATISGLNQPLPLVRFQLLVQKAAEICQEVKSLGNNMLSAMEKEDNETISILRTKHERIILGMVENVKYAQLQEAIKAQEGLSKSLETAIHRYTYYEKQLGKSDNEIIIPEMDKLDLESLNKMKFLMSEPEIIKRDIEIDIAEDLESSGGKKVSSFEAEEMEKLERAKTIQDVVRISKLTAQGIGLLPEFGIKLHYWGLGGDTGFGGTKLGKAASYAADVALAIADQMNYEASRTAKIGSYARREQEWVFQSNLAAAEINQAFKQLRAAQIRKAIAEKEYENHKQQIKNAEEIENFLNAEGNDKNGKKTNKALYAWMKREVKGIYGQAFQFAFDIAKKAELALQHELGDSELSYIKFDYLGGKEGLLAGEKLHLDIKRMEMTYHEMNQREYEITKHVSLLEVDPLALIQLRATGRCTIPLPEEIFDMDCPGHYFRRIKSVAISIPCVTGPYTSINCTLTLLKSSIRKNSNLTDGEYARNSTEDDRFSDYYGSLQSIVTSTGQNDSGMFETNLRDERYLPFEGSGVISEWQLELPNDVRQFDYDTISDVVLHIRYTAREGGGLLRNGATANLKTKIEESQTSGSVRLFSVRHEFPSEWAKFKNDNSSAAKLTLAILEEHYPYWSKDILKTVKRVDLFAKPAIGTKNTIKIANKSSNNSSEQDTMTKDLSLNGLLVGKLAKLPVPTGTVSNPNITLYFDDNSMKDLWIAILWGK